MKIHVICCNDSVEFAVVEDEDIAKEKMAELKESYFEKNRWNFRDNRNSYNLRCRWHINTVEGINK
jgi:hypothetical protein